MTFTFNVIRVPTIHTVPPAAGISLAVRSPPKERVFVDIFETNSSHWGRFGEEVFSGSFASMMSVSVSVSVFAFTFAFLFLFMCAYACVYSSRRC